MPKSGGVCNSKPSLARARSKARPGSVRWACPQKCRGCRPCRSARPNHTEPDQGAHCCLVCREVCSWKTCSRGPSTHSSRTRPEKRPPESWSYCCCQAERWPACSSTSSLVRTRYCGGSIDQLAAGGAGARPTEAGAGNMGSRMTESGSAHTAARKMPAGKLQCSTEAGRRCPKSEKNAPGQAVFRFGIGRWRRLCCNGRQQHPSRPHHETSDRRPCCPPEKSVGHLPALGHCRGPGDLGRVLWLELWLGQRRHAGLSGGHAAGGHHVHHLHLQLHRAVHRHSACRWPLCLCAPRLRATGGLCGRRP